MDNSPAILFNNEFLDGADRTHTVTMFSVPAKPCTPPVLIVVCLDTQSTSKNDSRVEVEITEQAKGCVGIQGAGLILAALHKKLSARGTVQHVIDLLVGMRRNRYRYDEHGSDYLYWTTTVLKDFQSQGWITQHDVEEFDNFFAGNSNEEKDAYWIRMD